MVRTEKGKLIIEIELDGNETAAERLLLIRGTINDAIAQHDYNNFGSLDISWLMGFAKELELTKDQIKI